MPDEVTRHELDDLKERVKKLEAWRERVGDWQLQMHTLVGSVKTASFLIASAASAVVAVVLKKLLG